MNKKLKTKKLIVDNLELVKDENGLRIYMTQHVGDIKTMCIILDNEQVKILRQFLDF